jgi:hypothetical protein
VAVAEAIDSGLAPIRSRFDALDDDDVMAVMDRNGALARERAAEEMLTVREKVGLGR